MRWIRSRLLIATAVLILLSLLAALFGSRLISAARHRTQRLTCVTRAADVGWRRISSVFLWLDEYRASHGGMYPYSPDGSDAALELLVSAGPGREWLEHELTTPMSVAARNSKNRFLYLYLNPVPDSQLPADTILLVERDFYYGSKGVHVLTAEGKVHYFLEIPGRPKDLLGKRLSELTAQARDPESGP
jgi:hypothetical protein